MGGGCRGFERPLQPHHQRLRRGVQADGRAFARPAPQPAGGRIVFELVPAIAEAIDHLSRCLGIELLDGDLVAARRDGKRRVVAIAAETAGFEPQELEKEPGRRRHLVDRAVLRA